MAHEHWLRKTINLAHKHVSYYQGEPFAAIVVKGGSIVGQGTDLVAERKDPTAHAEIEAIREACQVLGTTDLSGCILYASAHPCPMCLAAAYWAGVEAVYFVYDLEELDAAGLGAGGEIYQQLTLPMGERSVTMAQLANPDPEKNPLALWQQLQGQ